MKPISSIITIFTLILIPLISSVFAESPKKTTSVSQGKSHAYDSILKKLESLNDESQEEAVTSTSFNLVSIITTTGYATTDYSVWGSFAVIIFFFATFSGACAGSTAGGFKILRFQMLIQIMLHQLKQILYPHGVFSIKYNGKVVEGDILQSVIPFAFLWTLSIVAMCMVLTWFNLDFITSLIGAITAIANVGPGLGDVIGPVDMSVNDCDFNWSTQHVIFMRPIDYC